MSAFIATIFIVLTAFAFVFGARLGENVGEADMKREAVKLGHAHYTNDVSGASVWAWKTVKE
jgi:hypothetical protein